MSTKRLAGLVLLAASVVLQAAGALEISATYRLENLAFDPDRQATDTSFSGEDLLMGFSLGVRQSSGPELLVGAEYVYDAVLRNILTGLVTYRGNLFSFGVGPFLGFLNTESLWPKVGVASMFRVEWPGAAFVQLWLDNSSNNRLRDEGDYLQERNILSFGFYVPHAICSLNVSTKRFAEKNDDGEVADTLSEYSFVADIYEKNVPFKVMITFGLQSLQREFDDGSDTTTHTLSSLVLGTRCDVEAASGVSISLDLTSSIYTFGQDELLGLSNPGFYLFRAIAGVTIDVQRLQR